MIYSTAYNENNNIEFQEVMKKNIPMVSYPEVLAQLFNDKYGIAVSGTHGKTTTSSLLASVFLQAERDPSFVLGGLLSSLNTNGRFGKSEYFIAEADESDGSFLKTNAFGAIVTNLEEEHLAYWKSPKRLKEAFKQFCSQVEGPLFWCRDDLGLLELQPRGTSYGFSKEANWQITHFETTTNGVRFSLSHQGKELFFQPHG